MERHYAGVAWVLVWITLLALPAWATPVAVVDFEMADSTAPGQEAAFGLADVLAAELHQRGVELFERQQIRVVLGERRITASGLMQLEKNSAFQIPDVQYLITGNIRLLTNQQFHIETALVDAHTGRNVVSFDREGSYPGNLPSALETLADQLANRLNLPSLTTTPEAAPRGRSNRTPEANLLFYKGIAYCLAGQPEMGVTWFIDAQVVAPNYLPARVWTMRAFEMLGLSEFATVARAKVWESLGGPAILNRLDSSPFLNQKLITVIVLTDPRLETADQGFQTALKNALAQSTNFFIADPSNIRALAAEMDLQLTENGERDLELASVLWSVVDALVLVTSDPSDAHFLSVELRDTLSGECWFRERVRRDFVQLEKLARKLTDQISTRHLQKATETAGHSSGRGRAQKPAVSSNTDRREFASLLRYVAENPGDRPALQQLAMFSCWLNATVGGRYGLYDERYEYAISDRIVAATKPDDPEAARWLSIALWHRRYHEDTPAPIIEAAATLFERYPNSPEAQYARSVLALEYIDQQKYAEAAPIFLKLDEELPQLAKRVKIGPGYWANFYFFTAAALYQIGDIPCAKQFLAQADDVLRLHSDLVIRSGVKIGGLCDSVLGVWVNHFPACHPLFGPERNLRQAVAEWQQRLSSAGTNVEPAKVTLEQLEQLLAEARQTAGADAETKLFQFLRQLGEHQRLHPELYHGKITAFDPRQPWRQIRLWNATAAGNYTLLGKLILETPGVLKQFVLDCSSSNKLYEVQLLTRELSNPLDAPIAADFLEAVGEYELALQKNEFAQKNPTPFPDSLSDPAVDPTFRRNYEFEQLRRQKIRLLQMLGKYLEAAAYARAQIPRGTNRPPADVCMDAADAYMAAGRPDEASHLFGELVRMTGDGENMDEYGATLRLCWADYEVAGGNLFEASEILRVVARQSEGKHWGVYLQTGYCEAYDAAVSRLAKLRAHAQAATNSTDWENVRQKPAAPPATEERNLTELERELNALLRGTNLGGGRRSYGGSSVSAFIEKYGHDAVPALLDAAVRDDESAQWIASFRILDRVATAEDAPAVLEAFKRSPHLAQTAFRLDRSNAIVILRERFGIYAKGGDVSPELRQVIAQYGLLDQYPLLMANLTAKDLDGNTALIATELDRMLQTNSTPALLESFHAALAATIERQMRSHYRRGLATLGEIALHHGWVEGLEALRHGQDTTFQDALYRIRKYMDLPDDDTEAWMLLESGLGRWQWNANTRKFVSGPNASTNFHPNSQPRE